MQNVKLEISNLPCSDIQNIISNAIKRYKDQEGLTSTKKVKNQFISFVSDKPTAIKKLEKLNDQLKDSDFEKPLKNKLLSEFLYIIFSRERCLINELSGTTHALLPIRQAIIGDFLYENTIALKEDYHRECSERFSGYQMIQAILLILHDHNYLLDQDFIIKLYQVQKSFSAIGESTAFASCVKEDLTYFMQLLRYLITVDHKKEKSQGYCFMQPAVLHPLLNQLRYPERFPPKETNYSMMRKIIPVEKFGAIFGEAKDARCFKEMLDQLEKHPYPEQPYKYGQETVWKSRLEKRKNIINSLMSLPADEKTQKFSDDTKERFGLEGANIEKDLPPPPYSVHH